MLDATKTVAYFPENDDDEEKKNASADNGKDDHPELDLFTYWSSANHCQERLHLRHSTSRLINDCELNIKH